MGIKVAKGSDLHRRLVECGAISAKAKPKRRDDGYKSQLEADYAAHLDVLVRASEIVGWLYEPVKGLRLGDDLSYSPDWIVINNPDDGIGPFYFVETKGYERRHDRTTFISASRIFWFIEFRMVKRIDGVWVTTRRMLGGKNL
jgi:hypothetical protein